jgi:hypothetical protein
LLLVMLAATSCSTYYKAHTYKASEVKNVNFDSLNKASKFFVLRAPYYAFAMYNPTVKDSALSFIIDTLPFAHGFHMMNSLTNRKQPHNPSSAVVTNEVHLYISDTITDNSRRMMTIPLSQFYMAEVLQDDLARTRASHALGIIGVSVGIILAVITVGGIAALSNGIF